MENMVQWVDECHENSAFVRDENLRLLRRLCEDALLLGDAESDCSGGESSRGGDGGSKEVEGGSAAGATEEDSGGSEGGGGGDEQKKGGVGGTDRDDDGKRHDGDGGNESEGGDAAPALECEGKEEKDGGYLANPTPSSPTALNENNETSDTAAAAVATPDQSKPQQRQQKKQPQQQPQVSVSLKEYGSTAYGLALPDSDLDYVLVVTTNNNHNNNRDTNNRDNNHLPSRGGEYVEGRDDVEGVGSEVSGCTLCSSNTDSSSSTGSRSSSRSSSKDSHQNGATTAAASSTTTSSTSTSSSNNTSNNNGYQLSRAKQLEYLGLVAAKLSSCSWVSNMTYISTAGVPVIKYVGVGGRHVDVSCMGSSHQGLRTHAFLTSEVKARPCLRPLVLVLKQLLRDHELDEKARGGLSSFGLFVVVRCFLAWHEAMLEQMKLFRTQQQQQQLQQQHQQQLQLQQQQLQQQQLQQKGGGKQQKGGRRNNNKSKNKGSSGDLVGLGSEAVGDELGGGGGVGSAAEVWDGERGQDGIVGDEDDDDKSVGWLLLAFLEQHATQLDYRQLAFTVHGYAQRFDTTTSPSPSEPQPQHPSPSSSSGGFGGNDEQQQQHQQQSSSVVTPTPYGDQAMVVVDPFDAAGRNIARGLYRLSLLEGVLRAAHQGLSQRGARLESLVNTRPPPPQLLLAAANAATATSPTTEGV
jgi:hypothetical protein